MARLRTLRLLLNEIADKYVQENFYKLKLYIDDLEKVLDTGITGPQGPTGATGPAGPVATTVPKLTVVYNTDAGTAVGDLLKVTGSNFVSTIVDNDATTIPNGIFGVAFTKPTATTVEVLFIGVQGGYAGFTTGLPVFVQTDGTPGQTVPTTGMVQQIGFAVSTSDLFMYLTGALEKTP